MIILLRWCDSKRQARNDVGIQLSCSIIIAIYCRSESFRLEWKEAVNVTHGRGNSGSLEWLVVLEFVYNHHECTLEHSMRRAKLDRHPINAHLLCYQLVSLTMFFLCFSFQVRQFKRFFKIIWPNKALCEKEAKVKNHSRAVEWLVRIQDKVCKLCIVRAQLHRTCRMGRVACITSANIKASLLVVSALLSLAYSYKTMQY